MMLPPSQLQQVRELVQQQVSFYDLQAELTDHLASDIEDRLCADSSTGFEKALQMAYAGFGSSGFRLVVRQRRLSLQQQRWKQWMQFLKREFTTYRLLHTAGIYVILYSLMGYREEIIFQLALLPGLAAFGVYQLAIWMGKPKSEPALLLTEIFRAVLFRSISLSQPGFWRWNNYLQSAFFENITLPQLVLLGAWWFLAEAHPGWFALLATVAVCMLKATANVNKAASQQARQLYPEAFAAA